VLRVKPHKQQALAVLPGSRGGTWLRRLPLSTPGQTSPEQPRPHRHAVPAGAAGRPAAAHMAMQRPTPVPSGSGSVMWCASQVKLPPMYSARMGAPRARACSSSSSTSTPARALRPGLAGEPWGLSISGAVN